MKSKRFVLGIGMRLTLWGAVLTTLLCTIVCGALYAGLFFSLRSQIDTFLTGEIDEFMLTVNEYPHDDAGLQAALRRELGVRAAGDLEFRLIDRHGAVIVSSDANDPLRSARFMRPERQHAEAGVHCETVYPENASSGYRVCSLAVTTLDGRQCVAQSSYLLHQMHDSLAAFRRIGAVVMLTAAVTALGVGGFLAHRSLQPIRRIMQMARRMGSGDLQRRIPLSGSGDEMDQLAATLNGMLDRIESQVLEIQQFTADASHELRTPLAALRGSAEVALSQRRCAEELRRTIEDSLEQYARLQRVAEDLLLLARYDAGGIDLPREIVQLDRIMANVVDLYLPTAEEKGVSVALDDAPPLSVPGDGGRLRQVVGNLVDNAIKYTPPAGRVRVSLRRVNGIAQLEVEDTGVGISTKDLPRVFDRFFRADVSRSRESAPGIGLGLPICRSIVEAHGGQVFIQSELGKGTIVRVWLPVDGRSLDRGTCRVAAARGP